MKGSQNTKRSDESKSNMAYNKKLSTMWLKSLQAAVKSRNNSGQLIRHRVRLLETTNASS